MKIPGTLAVMALPGAVLFPGSMLPLYIFEPRYRTMLADSLDGERMFAIGQKLGADEDAEICEVGGAGFVRACVANPDGTSRLILQGVSRVRFREWLPGEPYRLAKVEPMSSECGTPLLAESLRGEVRQLCEVLLKGNAKPIGRLLDSAGDHAEFSDFVGANLVEDTAIRQRLMEETDVTRRLEILAAYLTPFNTAN
jgi:Lon protease-like protein